MTKVVRVTHSKPWIIARWACEEARNPLKAAARPISRAGMHAIFLPHIGRNFYRDLAKSFIRIRLRVVCDGVGVDEIFPYVLERLNLLLPGLGEIGLAARSSRDAAKH